MLLRERRIYVSQENIRDIIGVPSSFEALARCLNQFDISDDGKIWQRLVTDNNDFKIVVRQKNIGVLMIEPREMAHAVYVEKRTKNGLIFIKDPFDQTAYKMTTENFFKHWSGFVIARWVAL